MSSLVVNTAAQAQSSDAANAVKEVAKVQATVMPVSSHKAVIMTPPYKLFYSSFIYFAPLIAFSFDTQ